MSAVERVRETARLMRERAEAVESYAGQERWRHDEIGWDDRQGMTWDVFAAGGILVGAGAIEEVAEHIASLDPEVARRIADWLEQAAALIDEAGDGPLAIVAAALTEPAVAVADAYLGDES